MADHNDFPILVLDGGMGTTLQAPPFGLPLDSALWSSELLSSDEGLRTLRHLHQTWVDAGAEVLGSCSYQSSLPLFKTQISGEQQALSTMLAALPVLAKPFEPSKRFGKRIETKVALSLGPFGAQMQPGQEYSGCYCEPFGRGSTSKLACSATHDDLPLQDVDRSDDTYEDSLAAWHLARLRHFATSLDWPTVSMIAFETIPNAYEARAIRRAMSIFNKELGHSCPPYYVSFVFPLNDNGEAHYPDRDLATSTLNGAVDTLVSSLFSPSHSRSSSMPFAVGINCTNPLKIGPVVTSFISSLRKLSLQALPQFVLYPDGGAVYDVVTRTWKNPDGLDAKEWARLVADQVEVVRKSGAFSGALVGGCCKAGPAEIAALRGFLQSRQLL